MKRIRELVPWTSSGSSVPVLRESDIFSSLHREMNRLFEDVFSSFGVNRSPYIDAGRTFTPRVNVEETDGDLIVTAEVPGLEEKDINISLANDALTISGEKQQREERREGKGIYYSETLHGAFERTIPLRNIEIDPDRVQAVMKNGCLTITLPKTESEKRTARKVSIKTE